MRFAALWVVVAACGGKSPPPKAAEPAPPPLTVQEAQPREAAPPPAGPVVITAPPPPPATQMSSNPVLANDLAMLPVDSEMVLGFDLGRMRQSNLWAQISPRFASKMGFVDEFTKTCGFDPLATMTTVAIGVKGMNGTPSGVFVVHGIPTAQLGACVPKLRAKVAKTKTKLTTDTDTFTLAETDGRTTTFGFIDATTLLAVTGGKAEWAAAKTASSALPTSAAFMEMFHLLSATDAGVVLANGTVLSKASSMGINVKAAFGSLDLTDVLAMDIRIRLSTPDEANQLASMTKGQTQSAQVKQMFQKFDISTDRSDVRFQIEVSSATLIMLLGAIGI
jgi:hypothetical protein